MKVLAFDYDEKIAITENDGLIEVWTANEYSGKGGKVFSKTYSEYRELKCVLSSDRGEWFKSASKAPYCLFKSIWLG